MEKKNKTKIIIGIIALLIIVTIGGLYTLGVFNKPTVIDNGKEEKDKIIEKEKVEEISNYNGIPVAILESHNDYTLYLSDEDGNKKGIFNFKDYYNFGYRYFDDKIYLYTNKIAKDDGGDPSRLIYDCTVGYIDLNDTKYEFKELLSKHDFLANSIAYANNNIYLTTYEGFYKYDINTKKFTLIDELDKLKTYHIFPISNNQIGYNSFDYTKGNTIGILNIDNYKTKEITTYGNYYGFYNNKIIYKIFNNNDLPKGKFYEYDVTNGDNNKISDTIYQFSLSNELIIPNNNYYIYFDNRTLYKYSNGETQKLYEFDSDIFSIIQLSKNTINILTVPEKEPTKYYIFNLETLECIEDKDKIYYDSVIYINK